MYKVAVIGSGQLGSRHLQGIKKANMELLIEVFDSNTESLKIAENRYNEIEGNLYKKDVRFLSSIDELSEEFDLIIIATSSAPRFNITYELINKKSIKNIVFEKVLFQNEKYFHEVKNLLKSNNINAWVNCPRRMFDYYTKIKESLSNENKIIFTVIGGEWGIGCNSIHFIDIISYLTNQTNYSLITSGLNKNVYPSKRSGYVEFCGVLSGTTHRGDIFTFISQEVSSATALVSIIANDKKYIIDEANGTISSFVNNKWNTDEISVPFQSQLTGTLVENILLDKKVELTTYEESMTIHIPFISSLLDFYNLITGKSAKNCPIT